LKTFPPLQNLQNRVMFNPYFSMNSPELFLKAALTLCDRGVAQTEVASVKFGFDPTPLPKNDPLFQFLPVL